MNQSCDNIREISAPELQEMLQTKGNPPLLIDVRQPQEYKAGHIPGALLFPLGQVELVRPLLNESRSIVVYCRSGKRSLAAAGILCRLGFPQIFSLKGGIMGWDAELIKGPPQETLSPTETKSIMDILLTAMEKELTAHRLYTEELENEHTTTLNNLLQNLANREKEHLSLIYQKYLSYTEKQNLPQKSLEVLQQEILAANVQEKETIPSFKSREDLLEMAIQQEFFAYDFYRTSAEQIKDSDLQGLLFELSFEERNHAASLLKLIPYPDSQ